MKFKKGLALVVMCTISTATVGMAYAEDMADLREDTFYSATDYEEYVLENSREGKVTPESIEKFNEHIALLDPENAKAILNDEELAYCMKLDTYWEEPNATDIALYAAVELPLEKFPADGKTYFSVDTSVGCECHKCTCYKEDDERHGCTFDVPSGFSKARCYFTEEGKSGTCRRFNNSIQCKAFADYVFKTYTGSYCGSSNEAEEKVVTASEWSVAEVKSALLGISKGSHVRGKLAYYPHSIIVLSTNASGITYYHANGDGHCLISVETRTWSSFANWFKEITYVWEA